MYFRSTVITAQTPNYDILTMAAVQELKRRTRKFNPLCKALYHAPVFAD